MSAELRASKVAVFEGNAQFRNLSSAPTTVAGAVGLAEKGPYNQALLCTSYERYRETFGGFSGTPDLALAAMGYFDNGGNQLWVARVAPGGSVWASAQVLAHTMGTGDPATVTGTNPPPFALVNGAQLTVTTDGGAVTLTFDATSASLRDTSPSPVVAPFALVAGATLTLTVDGGAPQTVSFAGGDFVDIGAATAQEVADAINAAVTGVVASSDTGAVVIDTVSKGTASSVAVTGGTTASASAVPAQILSTATYPVSVNNGNGLTITAAGNPYAITFSGAAAVTLDPAEEPYVLANSLTLKLSVNGGAEQTVTFATADFADIAAATADEVADVINAQITGATASASAGIFHVTTASRGSASSIQVTGGSALAASLLPAQILSTATFPVSLNNGNGLTITAAGNPYAITFSGSSAVTLDSNAEPFLLVDGMTMIVVVDGGAPQTVLFSTADFADIAAATADEVADVINAQLTGATAAASAGVFHVTTTSRGTDSSIQVTGGTAVSGTSLAAEILSSATFPVAMTSGAGLEITANGNPYDITVTATPAVLRDTDGPVSEPYVLSDGDTLSLTVDGSPQSVVFSAGQFGDISQALADELVSAISLGMSGVVATNDGGMLEITTLSSGTASSITVTPSAGASALGFDGETAAGGGNVADISAVEWEEIAALLTVAGGDDDFTVSDTGTAIRFATNDTGSDSSIQASGTAATALGLDTDPHVGSDGDRLGVPTGLRTGSGNVASLAAVEWEEVAALLTTAGGDTDFAVSDTGTAIRFATVATGASASIQASGTATAALGLDTSLHQGVGADRLGIPTGAQSGSGNVANLAAVTRAEVASLLTTAGGDTDFTATDTGAAVLVATVATGGSATVQASGTATTALGLDTNAHIGMNANVLGLRGQSGTGTGNVANIGATTIAEISAISTTAGGDTYFQITDLGTAIKLSSVSIGVSATLQVSGSAATSLGLDTSLHTGSAGAPGTTPAVRIEAQEPGPSGNVFSVQVTAATNADPDQFNLLVFQSATLTETFENLSRVTTSPRFVETIVNDTINGSQLVRAINLANAPGVAAFAGTYALSGGVTGTLTDADFLGDEMAGTGLHALDGVADLAVVFVPGRATPTIHNGIIAYCEVFRSASVFAVLDPPANLSAADMVTYVTTTAALEGASDLAAIYWPRVKILNPDRSVFGSVAQLVVPPSGIIAGVYGRTDGARPGGVYDQPAGIEEGRMIGVSGFETNETLEERRRDVVYPHRINPLTTGPGLPRFIDGARTLKNGNFPFVAERRGTIFIDRSLKAGLAFIRQKNNTADLRAQVQRTITAFLITQMNNGAFRSRDPATAFFVDVSDALNPASIVFAGKLVARVGVATKKPAEYVILDISQDTRAFQF